VSPQWAGQYEKICEFDIDIQWTPGKLQSTSDFLSRLRPCEDPDNEPCAICRPYGPRDGRPARRHTVARTRAFGRAKQVGHGKNHTAVDVDKTPASGEMQQCTLERAAANGANQGQTPCGTVGALAQRAARAKARPTVGRERITASSASTPPSGSETPVLTADGNGATAAHTVGAGSHSQGEAEECSAQEVTLRNSGKGTPSVGERLFTLAGYGARELTSADGATSNRITSAAAEQPHGTGIAGHARVLEARPDNLADLRLGATADRTPPSDTR
jgi:hypothetical protein